MKKIKNKNIWIGFATLAVLLFLFFKSQGPAKPVYQEIQPTYGTIREIISTTGLVQPQNRLEVIPPISGRIEKILVNEGDVVQAGQVLASMSSTDRAALLDAAQSQGPDKVKYWQEAYKPTSLLSPINGKVIVRNIEPGQTVNTNTAVLVLADRLIIRAQVDETDIGRVAVGQKAEITLDAYPDVKIDGRVSRISYESTIVNNVTIYTVEITPASVPSIFRSGMSANINIIRIQKNRALLLPEKAVSYKDNQPQVLVKEAIENKARPITLGLTEGGNVEVLSGLASSETVLVDKSPIKQTKRTTSFISRPGQNTRSR